MQVCEVPMTVAPLRAVQAYVVMETARRDGTLIDDATAKTVSSWFQSPGNIGNVMAAFVSGVPVSGSDLANDAQKTINTTPNLIHQDLMALSMLIDYARQ